MNIQQINDRVDLALRVNRRAEGIILAMSAAIFLVGIAILIFAYWQQNPYVAGGAAVLTGFLYWPINEVRKLRRDNLILQVVPVMVSTLPAPDAAQEIKKLLSRLRGEP